MSIAPITKQATHCCMTKQLMKNYLFDIIRVTVAFLHDIYRAVIKQKHAKCRRFDGLRRSTIKNGMWQITKCPTFLNRHRQRDSELVGDGSVDARDGAVQLAPIEGHMCFVHDGVRTVSLGTRE